MAKAKEIRKRSYDLRLTEDEQSNIEFIAKLWDASVVDVLSGMMSAVIKLVMGELQDKG